MKNLLLGLVILFGSFSVHAASLDLALSNDTANLVLSLDRDPLYTGTGRVQDGGAELAVGAFLTEIGDNLVYATLLARGVRQSYSSQTQFSAGMKLLGGEIEIGEDRENSGESESVGALALGFQASLLLLPSQHNPVDLSIEGFYAPSITSFSDAERFSEISARLQIEIMPRARAYIGYRRLGFDTNDSENVRLDRHAHFGLSISF